MKKIIFIIIMLTICCSMAAALFPDSDRDTVRDLNDKCPNSVTDLVDIFGCSCEQKILSSCIGAWCCKENEYCIDAECRAQTIPPTEQYTQPAETQLTEEHEFTFIIYGDTEKDKKADDIHRSIVKRIVKLKPDMVFHVGDMVRFQFLSYQWDRFFDIISPIRESGIKFYAARGDAESGRAWKRKMVFLPGNNHYYTVEADNVLFIIFDINQDISIGSPQYQFIENALKNNDKGWVFVIDHYPFYNAGHYKEE